MTYDPAVEANIRRAAFQAYDYVMTYSPKSETGWCRMGEYTRERADRLRDLVGTLCGNCDMTAYLPQVWEKLNQLMRTFGEPR